MKNLLFVSCIPHLFPSSTLCSTTPPSCSLFLLHLPYISISLSLLNIQYTSFGLSLCVCAAFHFSFVNFTLKHKHAITTIIYFSLNRVALIELLILLSVVASLIEYIVYNKTVLNAQYGGIQLAFTTILVEYTIRIVINRSNLKPNRIHRHRDNIHRINIYFTLCHIDCHFLLPVFL